MVLQRQRYRDLVEQINPTVDDEPDPEEELVRQGQRWPGNVVLNPADGGLHVATVVNVRQVYTADRSELGDWIGVISPHRVQQTVAGIWQVLEPPPPS